MGWDGYVKFPYMLHLNFIFWIVLKIIFKIFITFK